MNRLLSPFILSVTGILALAYAYVAWRLAWTPLGIVLLSVPFLFVWIVPVIYWAPGRESGGKWNDFMHAASYLCMGWVNFLVVFTLVRDALLLVSGLFYEGHSKIRSLAGQEGAILVVLASGAALMLGILAALRGPRIKRVRVPIESLDPALEGMRIVQISDLHVGLFIGVRYVRRVVHLANRLQPDWVALTGDLVDGPVERLASQVAPLADLAPRGRVYAVLGNHEYYSGVKPWIEHFHAMGLRVLLNESVELTRESRRVVIGGVVDPAAARFRSGMEPRPDQAAGSGDGKALRILLAHHPKLAPLAERAGFDLQLSGHTHAGQFFPWTLVVRLLHAPHVAGLSRQGRLWVYVSAGTGTWGPPVRFGTQPELTLLTLTSV